MPMKRKLSTNLQAAAKLLGRKGGKRGGPARAKSLTAEQRESIARKGGNAKAGH